MSPPDAMRVGHDLVSVARFRLALERHEAGLRRRVFTPAEWDAAGSRANRDEALAVRFAAKEAVMKALGTGWSGGVGWRDIEVVGGEREAPRVRLHGRARAVAERGAYEFAISLTHAGGMASAVVVAWSVRAAR